jgi:hypothetical protein
MKKLAMLILMTMFMVSLLGCQSSSEKYLEESLPAMLQKLDNEHYFNLLSEDLVITSIEYTWFSYTLKSDVAMAILDFHLVLITYEVLGVSSFVYLDVRESSRNDGLVNIVIIDTTKEAYETDVTHHTHIEDNDEGFNVEKFKTESGSFSEKNINDAIEELTSNYAKK